VYCWRGGQRSGTLAWFLDQVGFRTHLLQGGYKAFRTHVRHDTAERVTVLSFVVIGGRTGSGKSRLLQHLQREGAQVLDLEALACHRGSVLGALPDRPQPSQKHFETRVWSALRAFDPSRPVFVESESRKIGQMQVPTELIERMRTHGRMVRLEMPLAARVALLLEDYRHFEEAPQTFLDLLRHFIELQGHERVDRWRQLALQGRWADLYAELVQLHYDPLYDRSMAQNYRGLASALEWAVDSGNEQALRAAAQGLIERLG
jgi:tRNA 2-selenouridine synthase